MDEDEALAELRQRAQDAFSRARLAADGLLREQWQDIGNAWLAVLEARNGMAPPLVDMTPGLGGGSSSGRKAPAR